MASYQKCIKWMASRMSSQLKLWKGHKYHVWVARNMTARRMGGQQEAWVGSKKYG